MVNDRKDMRLKKSFKDIVIVVILFFVIKASSQNYAYAQLCFKLIKKTQALMNFRELMKFYLEEKFKNI